MKNVIPAKNTDETIALISRLVFRGDELRLPDATWVYLAKSALRRFRESK